VEQQLLGESAGGDGLPDGLLLDIPLTDVPLPNVPLPDVPLPDVPLPDVPLPHVALPDVPLPDIPLPESRQDGSVGEERPSPRVAEEACVWVRVGFLSCEFSWL